MLKRGIGREQEMITRRKKFHHWETSPEWEFSDDIVEYLKDHPLPADFFQDTALENFDDVRFNISPELDIILSRDSSMKEWTFDISAKVYLSEVTLLDGSDKDYFSLSCITRNPGRWEETIIDPKRYCRRWINPASLHYEQEYRYTFEVKFKAPSHGTFRQSVEFLFHGKPAMVKDITVVVVTARHLATLDQARKRMEPIIKRYRPKGITKMPYKQEAINFSYPLPISCDFITHDAVVEHGSERHYRTRQHQFLYIEEMTQQELLSRYNCISQLLLIRFDYGTLAAYAEMTQTLSEEFDQVQLIMDNCDSLLLAPAASKGENNRKVYEAVIERKWNSKMLLRLPDACVEDLKLQPESKFEAELQFQLNPTPFSEMHIAVDRLEPLSLIFPVIRKVDIAPWKNSKMRHQIDSCLNDLQKEAVRAITAPLRRKLPPILIAGPFGTGKTFTCFEAVKTVLRDPRNRLLLCTHSNRAADAYIIKYIHPYVSDGHEDATPLRLYHSTQYVHHLNPTVKKYCMLREFGNRVIFAMPEVEDILKYRIVVSNITTSHHLSQIGLGKGFFTHIFIDDAAQALECETIIPLCLATESTRIVLAGDMMLNRPKVYDELARQCGFDTSLMSRLWSKYPALFPCKFNLTENYSSHTELVKFAAEEFYGDDFFTKCSQPAHKSLYPLAWLPVKADKAEGYSIAEFQVNKIVEMINQLKASWPAEWGLQDRSSFGILTQYSDQVAKIRKALRKKNLSRVFVGKLSNAEGKHFRVLFLCIVRRSNICCTAWEETVSSYKFTCRRYFPDVDFLVAAFTRAQSLIAVVGNPNFSCRFKKQCRNPWKKFLDICRQKRSLHTSPDFSAYRNTRKSSRVSAFEANPVSSVNTSSRTAEELATETRGRYLFERVISFGLGALRRTKISEFINVKHLFVFIFLIIVFYCYIYPMVTLCNSAFRQLHFF